MRLYSFYASQVDYFREACTKFLALNALHELSLDDLSKFIDKLDDLLTIFTVKDIDDFFAKK